MGVTRILILRISMEKNHDYHYLCSNETRRESDDIMNETFLHWESGKLVSSPSFSMNYITLCEYYDFHEPQFLSLSK